MKNASVSTAAAAPGAQRLWFLRTQHSIVGMLLLDFIPTAPCASAGGRISCGTGGASDQAVLTMTTEVMTL